MYEWLKEVAAQFFCGMPSSFLIRRTEDSQTTFLYSVLLLGLSSLISVSALGFDGLLVFYSTAYCCLKERKMGYLESTSCMAL